MKILKYRRKIGRNAPFYEKKLNIIDEKIGEKNNCLNKLYHVRTNRFKRFKHSFENFGCVSINTTL